MKRLMDLNWESIINEKNAKISELDVRIIKNQADEEKHVAFGSDIRLQQPEFKKNSISFGCFDTRDELIAVLTIFELAPEYHKDIHFWKYDQTNKILNKISLVDLVKLDKYVVTLGFAGISLYRFRAVSVIFPVMYEILDLILQEESYFFIESTGVRILKPALFDAPRLSLDELKKANFDIADIGRTRSESNSTDVHAARWNLKKLDGIYNKWSLGKVHFNDALLRKYL